jgi:hypothetical protein
MSAVGLNNLKKTASAETKLALLEVNLCTLRHLELNKGGAGLDVDPACWHFTARVWFLSEFSPFGTQL